MIRNNIALGFLLTAILTVVGFEPACAEIVSVGAPASITYQDDTIDFTNYGPYPGTIAENPINALGTTSVAVTYDDTFDPPFNLGKADRLLLDIRNVSGMAWDKLQLSLTNGAFLFHSDSISPGIGTITNPSGPNPIFDTRVFVTDPGISFSSPYTTITFDFDKALGHSLASGAGFGTYLPIFGLNADGGRFDILETPSVNPVPEPSSLATGSIAMVTGLAVVWKRHRVATQRTRPLDIGR